MHALLPLSNLPGQDSAEVQTRTPLSTDVCVNSFSAKKLTTRARANCLLQHLNLSLTGPSSQDAPAAFSMSSVTSTSGWSPRW